MGSETRVCPGLIGGVVVEEFAGMMYFFGLNHYIIVIDVSHSKEIVLRQNGGWTPWHESCVELHCVMDADKLDALGVFGIFRCAAFSGSRNIPLYLDRDDPMYYKSAVGHFEDKLFRLETMMMTDLGRAVARRRTSIMRQVVRNMHEEANLIDVEMQGG